MVYIHTWFEHTSITFRRFRRFLTITKVFLFHYCISLLILFQSRPKGKRETIILGILTLFHCIHSLDFQNLVFFQYSILQSFSIGNIFSNKNFIKDSKLVYSNLVYLIYLFMTITYRKVIKYHIKL